MAISASIALSSATAKAAQRTTATLTISNSGGAAVLVTAIQPTMVVSGGTTAQSLADAVGVPMFGGAWPSSVAASGTLVIPFDVVAHAPTTSYGLAQPASIAYSVGATINTNDGSTTVATPATLTVTNPAGL